MTNFFVKIINIGLGMKIMVDSEVTQTYSHSKRLTI